MEEILFFSDQKSEDLIFEENPKKPTVGYTLKRSSENLPSDVIDDVVLQAVYGNSRKHPGDANSPCQKFLRTDPDGRKFIGVWSPPNKRCKSMALKLLFPSLSKAYQLPEIKHEPLHVAMAFDAFKLDDLMQLVNEFPEGVMRFGFFTCDDPTQAQLICKTLKEFETRASPPTYEERIILQISKENKQCFEAFSNQVPSYRSPNINVGEMDCKLFFPVGYDAPPEEEQIVTKKSKKKKKPIPQLTQKEGDDVNDTMAANDTAEDYDTQVERIDECGDIEDNDDEEDEEEQDEVEEGVLINEAEKATSPMEEV